MQDPFDREKTFDDIIDDIERNEYSDDDNLFDDMESLDEMKEEEFEGGVEGIDNWDEWN